MLNLNFYQIIASIIKFFRASLCKVKILQFVAFLRFLSFVLLHSPSIWCIFACHFSVWVNRHSFFPSRPFKTVFHVYVLKLQMCTLLSVTFMGPLSLLVGKSTKRSWHKWDPEPRFAKVSISKAPTLPTYLFHPYPCWDPKFDTLCCDHILSPCLSDAPSKKSQLFSFSLPAGQVVKTNIAV